MHCNEIKQISSPSKKGNFDFIFFFTYKPISHETINSPGTDVAKNIQLTISYIFIIFITLRLYVFINYKIFFFCTLTFSVLFF